MSRLVSLRYYCNSGSFRRHFHLRASCSVNSTPHDLVFCVIKHEPRGGEIRRPKGREGILGHLYKKENVPGAHTIPVWISVLRSGDRPRARLKESGVSSSRDQGTIHLVGANSVHCLSRDKTADYIYPTKSEHV